jgi:zinc transport system permease protein
MINFFHAIFEHSFIQYALIGSVLSCIATALIGPFIVVKKLGNLVGGISHSILGGMGIALFLAINPIYGAIVFAVIAAISIGIISKKTKQHEDIIINCIWAFSMALGVLFISKTPGYVQDLMGYLFGNILMINVNMLLLIAIFDLLIFLIIFLKYKTFVAISFDEEFSNTRGISTNFYYLLLLTLISLTIVVLIQVVGILLVIALLIIPSAISLRFTNSVSKMMLSSLLLGIIFSFLGLWISYGLNLPTGPCIVLVSAFFFFSLFNIRFKKFVNF